MKKNIVIIGSTGSIGRSALSLFDTVLKDFNILALSANENAALLKKQIKKYRPRYAVISAPEKAAKLGKFKNTKILTGIDGLSKIASLKSADTVLMGVVGATGIIPLISAIRAGKKIALANKESLVIAGELIKKELKKSGARLIPVDSEHSAIFQALTGHKKEYVKRFIITASGGPFKNVKKEKLKKITPEQALNHPTWKMGKKITIDSATLMNKGLEVIEAHYLFDIPYEKIDVVIHPQSVIHSMVEYIDGSIIAQLSHPDMKLPILYALTFPERKKGVIKPMKFTQLKKLEFSRIDINKFRAFKLALAAGKRSGTMPAVMNAANEAAVSAFLKKRIRFSDIPLYIERAMKTHRVKKNPTLEDVLKADLNTRKKVEEEINA